MNISEPSESTEKQRRSKVVLVLSAAALIGFLILCWFFTPHFRARIRSILLKTIDVVSIQPANDHPEWVSVDVGKGVSFSLPAKWAEGQMTTKSGRRENLFINRETKEAVQISVYPDLISQFDELYSQYSLDRFNHEWSSQFDAERDAIALTTAEIPWLTTRNEIRKKEFLLTLRNQLGYPHTSPLTYSNGENEHTRWHIFMSVNGDIYVKVYDIAQRGYAQIALGQIPRSVPENQFRFLNDLANTVRFTAVILPEIATRIQTSPASSK